MKISSVSKKVLASALSAAMVVAFAPTVAFGAQTMSAKVVLEGHAASGKTVAYESAFYDNGATKGLTTALAAAGNAGTTAIETVIGTDAKGADIPGTMQVIKASTSTMTATSGEDYIILAALDGSLNTTTYHYWTGSADATATAYAMYKFDGATVQALTDFEGTYSVPANVTLDLMGNTVVNDEDGIDAGGVAITALNVANGATVKNGTVKGNAIKTNAAATTSAPSNAIVIGASGVNASITLADVTVGSVAEHSGGNTSAVTMIGAVATGSVTADTVNVGNTTKKKTAEAATGKIAATAIDVAKSSKLAVTAEVAKKDLTATSDISKAAADNAAALKTYSAVAGALTMEEAAALTVDLASKVSKQDADTTAASASHYIAVNAQMVYGFNGTLAAKMAKDSSIEVNVTSTGDNIPVTAIDFGASTAANLTFGDKAEKTGYGVTVKATAKNAGDWDGDKTAVVATAIKATNAIKAENGVLEATASASDDARAYGIQGTLDATSAKGTATVTASALKDASAFAIYGALADDSAEGKYTGKIGTVADTTFTSGIGTGIKGGSFTQPLVKNTNYDPTEYEVVDADGYYTVKQFAGYGVPTFNDAAFPGLETAVENYLNEKDDAAGVALAEGVTLADLQKQCDQSLATDKQLQIIVKKGAYNAKKATEAEKAAFDAFCAYAKANLFLEPAEDAVNLQTISLGYYASDADKADKKPTVMATVTSLGTVTAGRTATENTQILGPASATKPVTQVVAFDGKDVVALPWVKSAEDDKYYVKTNKVYAAYATLTIDDEAVKDAAQEKPSTPAPAEKATQGIDVAKKSLTVKLGAKKTKTAKSKSFAMGASAETELTTAWKSGSTKITVSGDKVKLAKGAKRGTYTAKVSLKAAASDAYLAAAKTITVKFVIK